MVKRVGFMSESIFVIKRWRALRAFYYMSTSGHITTTLSALSAIFWSKMKTSDRDPLVPLVEHYLEIV